MTTETKAPEMILSVYRDGPQELEEALAGLSPAELDFVPAPGEWTIRQIVHHLVDSEATVLGRGKLALGEPGRAWNSNPFDQDVWTETMDYAHREVEPSLALFRAIRGHILQLIEHIPDAWRRYTISGEGKHKTFGAYIEMLAEHGQEHIECIRSIRARLKP